MKKKFVIIPVSIVAVAAIAVVIVKLSGSASAAVSIDSTELTKKDIESSIAITGTVESNSIRKVFSTLNYKVESINVKVGDKVKKGDILCTLNTDDIQNQILQTQMNIKNSDINSNYQLTDAEKAYNTELEKYNNNESAAIVNAKAALTQAEQTLQAAEKSYNDAIELKNTDKDTQLKTAKLNIESAENDIRLAQEAYDKAVKERNEEDYYSIKQLKDTYDDAKKLYDKVKTDFDSPDLEKASKEYEDALQTYSYMSSSPELYTAAQITAAEAKLKSASETLEKVNEKYKFKTVKEDYENATKAYTKAKADIDKTHNQAVDNAKAALDKAKNALEIYKNSLAGIESGNGIELSNYKTTLVNAQKAFETAKRNYELAVQDAENQLATLKAAAEKSRLLSGNDPQLIALESLKKTLDDCTIKAPIDGTVTAVYAVEGNSGAGLLFVIEDTDNLKIVSSVKEYDISFIDEGQSVIIKSDSIDKKTEYNGLIAKVAPTTDKGADGNDAKTGSFKVDVAVSSPDTDLLIGMTTKLTVITAEKENAFAVKYEAVVTKDDGTTVIYAAEKSGNGYIAKEIPVQTGIESNFEIEIISDQLKEGMIILTNTDSLYDGAPVSIDTSINSSETSESTTKVNE
jgi:RND family efflux transporter MFP subunit